MVTKTSFQYSHHAMEELQALLEKENCSAYGPIPKRFSNHVEDPARAAQCWRHSVIEWCYKFTDAHNFDREVVPLTLNFYDRYLYHQTTHIVTREVCQLVAVSSLYLAIKLHGIPEDIPPEHRARYMTETLNKLCYGIFDGDAVQAMERDILRVLDWRVNPPSMHSMITTMKNLVPYRPETESAKTYLLEATRYQLEVVIFDPKVLEEHMPSTIVYAALRNAVKNIEGVVLPSSSSVGREFYGQLKHMGEVVLGVDLEEVEELQSHLEEMVPELPSVESVHRQCFGEGAESSSSIGSQNKEQENPQEGAYLQDEGEVVRLGSNSPTNVMDMDS